MTIWQHPVFALPASGRSVGASAMIGWGRLQAALSAAPTRLTLRVSHPPRNGEGER